MSLNIKDETAHKLARQLADATGESMTQAVVEALRLRLAQVDRRRRSRATAEELLAIGRRCAKRLKRRPVPHGELLYDDRGLPK